MTAMSVRTRNSSYRSSGGAGLGVALVATALLGTSALVPDADAARRAKKHPDLVVTQVGSPVGDGLALRAPALRLGRDLPRATPARGGRGRAVVRHSMFQVPSSCLSARVVAPVERVTARLLPVCKAWKVPQVGVHERATRVGAQPGRPSVPQSPELPPAARTACI